MGRILRSVWSLSEGFLFRKITMHRGYIKLWRKFDEWEWYDDVKMVGLFIHFLMKANHKDTVYMGENVPRGSLVCGRNALSHTTNLSSQSIRSCIKRLKSTNEITIKSTNRFSIISIVNYELYQSESTSKTTSQVTNDQPATNQQLTTSKECNNEKNTIDSPIGSSLLSTKHFEKPDIESLRLAFESANVPNAQSEAENFFNFYSSKGWLVGKSPMKSWKHAVLNWAKNKRDTNNPQKKPLRLVL